MEDTLSILRRRLSTYEKFEYSYFGVFDGHNGVEAAQFAKENLFDPIVNNALFLSDNDEDVKNSIRSGFIDTHLAMWKEQCKSYNYPSSIDTFVQIIFYCLL